MTTLSFDLLWRDRGASKGMQDLAKHTERTSKSFHALKVGAGIALVAAGAAAVKFGTSSVKAYAEAQTAQVRLQDAFAKFPKLADTNISSLRKLNSQLALKTKFDDDATASGQAVLAQFGLTGQQLTKLTPLLQDYAAKTGKDLPAAAGVLGKAFLGNTRALKAIGIDYKMTGDKGKDFANIQRLVNEKVGGFAEKEGKSAAGQAAILRNQFGELKESAGEVLLPALLKVGGGLLKIVGLIRDNGAIFKTLGKTVKIVFESMVGSIGVGKGSFKDFSDWVATHQADITAAIINGGKGFVKFGVTVVKTAAAGLRAFGGFADGIGTAVSFILGQYADMAHGAALAFGWIPGIGPKLQAADVKFRLFATHAHNNTNKVGDAARGAADGLEGKLLPGLHKAGRGLDDYGRKAVTAAQKRDIVAKAEIKHRDALTAATKAAKENGKTLDKNTVAGSANRTALTKLVGTSQSYIQKLIDTGAKSKTVRAATATAREEFIKVATKMGVARDRAKELADKYFKIPKKRETKIEQPGMTDADRKAKNYNTKLGNIPGKKSTSVKVTFSSGGSVSLKTGGAKYIANATGGVLPGFTPGRDVHRFQSTSPGVPDLALSGGEAIMRPEWTKAVGGPKAVARMNRAAKRGNPVAFADGGTFASGEVPSMRPARNAPWVAEKAGSDIARQAGKAVATAAMKALKKQAAAAAAKAAASASGSVAGYSAGMAGTIARLRAAGARSFTTYPGHHPSMGKARDVTPHNWHIANVARASKGVWYVIYRMRIASKNHGNGWRQYHPISNRGDFRHTRHIHVAWYDRGGMLRREDGNGTGRPERVLSPVQTKSFDNLVRVLDRRGGAAVVNNHYTVNAPHYVGTQKDLVDALVKLNSRNQLAVLQR